MAEGKEVNVQEEHISSKLAKLLEKVEPYAKKVLAFLEVAIPIFITYCQKAHEFYCKLSQDAIKFILGMILCFFGGVFPTLFAALEAAKHGGLMILKDSLTDLAEEATVIIEASKKDDDADATGDGVKDVDQLTPKELLMRKGKLVLIKMNPKKVDNAIANIYTVWLSVCATLSIQFARTIAMSLTISEFLMRIFNNNLCAMVTEVTPPEYHKWIPVVAGWAAKSIAMTFAWTLQTIISAFTSALAGGLIVSRTFLKKCREKGIDFGGMIPKTDEETNIDEYLGYAFAAIGFYFQFRSGFGAPFPFNLVLWPLTMAEYYIRWSITK